MKIENILEIIEPVSKEYNLRTRRMDNKSSAQYSKDKIGGGHFSTVTKDRDPHFVKKTSDNSARTFDDGYWYFIKKVIDNKLWENPYFPRVYQFKRFKKRGRSHYRVQLETLVDLKSLRKEELTSIIERMQGKPPTQFQDGSERMAHLHIASIVQDLFNGISNPKGFDDNLIDAIKSLQNISGEYEADLNSYNIMGRRGPHGVHPVITDPFSFKIN